MLKPEDKAPDFSLPDQDGKNRTLSDFTGRTSLVYFYPKDDTPGCTKEACALSDAYGDFRGLGIGVVGISADSPESHAAFRKKYNLPFTLLSDPERKTISEYGAGSATGGTRRISYLLDASGAIIKAYPSVDPATHAQEILKDVLKYESGKRR